MRSKRFEAVAGLIKQEWGWLNAKTKCSLEALRQARTRELQFTCFYAVRSLQQARTRATGGKVSCFSYERARSTGEGISEWINYVVAWLPRDACRASRGKKNSPLERSFSNLVIDTELSNYFLPNEMNKWTSKANNKVSFSGP